jgi:hypothetical protein
VVALLTTAPAMKNADEMGVYSDRAGPGNSSPGCADADGLGHAPRDPGAGGPGVETPGSKTVGRLEAG